MKIFSNTKFKSLAATAAVMLFASSAVYATCQQDCDTYARAEAQKIKEQVYSGILQSCSQSAPYSYCQQKATTDSQNAYNSAYSGIYAQCTSTNCGG